MHRTVAFAVVMTCVLWACAHVEAQPAKIVRVGFLGPTSAASNASRMDALRAGLRDLGYVEGHNLVIEARWAEGVFDRLPALAAELVRLNVDVLLTAGTSGIRAAKQATTTIPIVMVTSGDPVAFGFVASLARPGGNITGSSNFSSELSAKRLELLKEAFPDTQRVGVMFNPDSAVNDRNLPVMEQMAKTLNLTLHTFAVRSAEDVASADAAVTQQRVEAIVLPEDEFITANQRRIVELVETQRLPSIGRADFAQAGGLIGYSVNFVELYRRAALFVDKILKGTKPADLPVERPTKFDLVINLKTARALGLTIPPSLLFLADEVIQ
jgi:putative tryptophan/tyrosine transport system substrate-binding protein